MDPHDRFHDYTESFDTDYGDYKLNIIIHGEKSSDGDEEIWESGE